MNIDLRMVDPNIIYLVLVVSLWMSVAALYVPGTGLLEVLAGVGLLTSLGLLIAAPTNWWAVALIVVGLLSFHVLPFLKPEWSPVAVVGLGLQAAGGIFLFSGHWVPWVLIVLTVTIALLYHYRVLMPMLRKSRNAPDESRDELLLGAEGRVLTPINPVGTVRVGGESWTATSEKPLKVGDVVIVLERAGLQLVVEGVKHKRTARDSEA